MEHALRRVADEIARRIREDTGTDGPHVFDTGTAYFQYLTDPVEPGIHLELPANRWRPDHLHISAADEKVLRDLGFNEPDEDWSNWYLETIDESEADSVAWAVVDALLTAYGVPIEEIAEGVGLPRVEYVGDPVEPFEPPVDETGVVLDPERLGTAFEAYLTAQQGPTVYRSPWQEGAHAAFFAHVDHVARTAVLDLYALVASGPGDTRATWLRRERLGWVVDPLMEVRLQHGKRVPLIALDRDTAAAVEPRMKFSGGPAVMDADSGAAGS